jgi:hypothetical protein
MSNYQSEIPLWLSNRWSVNNPDRLRVASLDRLVHVLVKIFSARASENLSAKILTFSAVPSIFLSASSAPYPLTLSACTSSNQKQKTKTVSRLARSSSAQATSSRPSTAHSVRPCAPVDLPLTTTPSPPGRPVLTASRSSVISAIPTTPG